MNKGLSIFANTMKIFALGRKGWAKIHVLNGVATVNNGHMLLRRPVGTPEVAVPNGMYDVDFNGNLIPSKERGELVANNSGGYNYNYEIIYPDPMLYEPKFAKMRPYCEAPKEALMEMCAFTQMAKQTESSVTIMDDSMVLTRDPGTRFLFPFKFPRPVTVDAFHLHHALVDMCHYDMVFFSQEGSEEATASKFPIFIGKDWSRCALIATKDGVH